MAWSLPSPNHVLTPAFSVGNRGDDPYKKQSATHLWYPVKHCDAIAASLLERGLDAGRVDCEGLKVNGISPEKVGKNGVFGAF